MPEQQLSVDVLRKALASLKKAVAKHKDEYVRDAAIRRFEYAYELTYQRLKYCLVQDEGIAQVRRLSRKDLIRLAAEKGLIENAAAWFDYHAARNEAYEHNDETAERIYLIAARFLPDANLLLAELERRNAKPG
ncbi:MAG: nucleotidyltransferase [Methylococcaceae bacterium]|nr:MAG: nucleotidyltransferase [Methylococcaceae bacterium]